MDISTTSINDLQTIATASRGGGSTGMGQAPENITYQIGGELPPPIKIEKGKGELNATVYCPIDVHPPPFGGPSNQVQGGNGQQGFSFSDNTGFPTGEYPVKNPLPSRDIPQNTLQYMDDQTRANYIPPSRGQNRDFLELGEPKIKEHRRKKYRKRILEDFWEETQIPLLLAVLFFVFSVPLVTETFQKYTLLYLPGLFNSEGFLNMYGLAFKALLFGGVYYGLTRAINFFVLEVE